MDGEQETDKMQAILWEEKSEVGRPAPLSNVLAECNVTLN